ncbi:MAG: Hsp70 family protein [Alphaproteobacteria bacterium]|nr:Hsp70 family protein [Alphaproteobacteria bacterium]
MYIGIDLGTSNSSIAGIIDGKPRVFRPADGGEVLPSMIYFDKRNHRLFGRRAYDKALISPENVISGFKRLMGSATKLEVKSLKQELSPEECAAEIIRQLLAQAQTETGNEKIDGAVITIPASFNQTQSQATLKAAQMAGLERVDLLQEPIAAAIASMQGAKRSGKFIIYDLGGGTFDIALAQAMNGDVTILAHQGINMLGGRDFDRMIVKNIVRPWLEKMFSLPKGFAAKKEYVKVLRIAQLAAEKAKIDLSSMDSTSIIASDEEIGVQDQNGLEMYLDIPLSKEQFNEIIRPYVLKTIDVIRNMCEEAEVKTTDIDRIVFIGGSSKIPLIRDIVAAELDIAADMKTDPMTTVAIGAAYYCESREWSVDNKSSSGAAKKATVSQDAKDKKFEISYAFTARTPNDKSEITVILSKEKPADFKIKIKNQEWDSGSLPLMDELTIQIPLNNIGDNVFEALIFDKNGNEQSEYTQNITIKGL